MELDQVLNELQKAANPLAKRGMTRFGIEISTALGVKVPDLRRIARTSGKDHDLAQELWRTGIHEARILASMIDDPKAVTPDQMDSWVKDFNSWDLCDQVCGNLFVRSEWRYEKALEYSFRELEFEKRAGFALMAWLAVHDKKATDQQFEPFFARIEAEADDSRNFVKKAVNWALRQIGKRNGDLHSRALATSRSLLGSDSKSAKWIAGGALKELQSPNIRERFA